MPNKKDSLGDRMKTYESVPRNFLTRRMPAIIRLDGKAFHTFTRGLQKPCDYVLSQTMQDTMKYLCENVQGCVFGYTQSDEITLILTDYDTITTEAWFGYNVQKMVSVSASMATLAFNSCFRENVLRWEQMVSSNIGNDADKRKEFFDRYYAYVTKKDMAMFDSRVFSVPKEDVANCLIWRQQDAIRNSIQSVGQSEFSHKELQGKSCKDIQEMLVSQKGISWDDDYATAFKRGSCCIKKPCKITRVVNGVGIVEMYRDKWVIDDEIPLFTEDRHYIERYL